MKQTRPRVVRALLAGVLVGTAILGIAWLTRRCPYAPCLPTPESTACTLAQLVPCSIDPQALLVAIAAGAAAAWWIGRAARSPEPRQQRRPFLMPGPRRRTVRDPRHTPSLCPPPKQPAAHS